MTNSDLLLRVHDLVLVDPETADFATLDPTSREAARVALLECPWVVALRTLSSIERPTFGIRGRRRHQRWETSIPTNRILKVVPPHEIRSDRLARARVDLPAMRCLQFLESKMTETWLNWGPGGSVGYELVTGSMVVHQESDLDLILRPFVPLSRVIARELVRLLEAAPAKVDGRVETDWGGFSLSEFAYAESTKILARTSMGPKLLENPWAPFHEEAAR